jgi:hypothetical protein
MDDQRTDREGGCMLARKTGRPSLLAMNFYGDTGERFTFAGEMGCGFTFIGFVIFVVVATILWQHFFN